MFVSPLPRGSDIHSVTSAGQAGFVTDAPESPQREAEQRRGFKTYPRGKSTGKIALGDNRGSQGRREVSVLPAQRVWPADPENSDVNLTASIETFIAGIQGQQTKDQRASLESRTSLGAGKNGIGEMRTDSTNNPHSSIGNEARFRRAGNTMEDYTRPSYMQSALGYVFPEAHANSYVVAGGGEQSAMPASSSYQVVLSDGTSYPSAVFPAGEQRRVNFSTIASCICTLPCGALLFILL